ncbi:MAG: metallophosphoesterase [Elusimicrobia bacterium]|nr:metallophosphoesterase [Elusimicrobiota bacterium]
MKNLILAIFITATIRVNAGAQQPPETIPAAVVSTTGASVAGACECRRCIAVYGDSRSNHDIHAKIAALIKARRPQAVFHAGDMVDDGWNKKAWEKFKEITKDLRESASFYAVLGNHEEGGEKTFNDIFRYPGNGRWYRAGLHGIRFIMLDVLSPLEKSSEQFKWLEAELNSPMNTNKFTAIVVHKPLMSSGRHWNEKWGPAKDLEALFMKYKVAVVLAGHDHNYERLEKDGLVCIVTGGGGADLRAQESKSQYSRIFAETNNYCVLSVCGEALKAEVFDINDKLIDSFEIPASTTAISSVDGK